MNFLFFFGVACVLAFLTRYIVGSFLIVFIAGFLSGTIAPGQAIKDFFKDNKVVPIVEASVPAIPSVLSDQPIVIPPLIMPSIEVSDVEEKEDENNFLFQMLPSPKSSLQQKAVFYAVKHGIDPALFKALIYTESRWRPCAVSPVGAVGLGQLMPSTGKRFGVQPHERCDPDKNLEGSARYLKFLMKKFKGDKRLVLASYNAGEGAVTKYGGIPPYRETRNYVKKIMEIYEGKKKA